MKRIRISILGIILACLPIAVNGQATAGNPGSLLGDFSLNWRLGNDSAQISFRQNTLMQESTVPAAMVAIASSYSDNIRDRGMARPYGANSPDIRMADYMQYAPLVIMAGVKIAGLDGKSDWLRLAATNVAAVGIMVVSVNGLKYTVSRPRPDGSSHNSFPSGHTATAFMSATMLHKEYGETVSPWFSVAGYGIAGSVAVARVIENRHWFSDIMAGAGIGTFSTLLAYQLSDGIFGNSHLCKRTQTRDRGEREDKWKFSMVNSYSFRSWTDGGSGIPDGFKPSYSLGLDISYLPWYIGPTVSAGVTQMQWTGEHRIFMDEGFKKPDVYWANAGLAFNAGLAMGISCNARLAMGWQTGGHYEFSIPGAIPSMSVNIPEGTNIRSSAGLSVKPTRNTEIAAFIGYDIYRKAWKTMNAGTSFTFKL